MESTVEVGTRIVYNFVTWYNTPSVQQIEA